MKHRCIACCDKHHQKQEWINTSHVDSCFEIDSDPEVLSQWLYRRHHLTEKEPAKTAKGVTDCVIRK